MGDFGIKGQNPKGPRSIAHTEKAGDKSEINRSSLNNISQERGNQSISQTSKGKGNVSRKKLENRKGEVLPKKNCFLSWCSKIWTSVKLNFCKDHGKRVEILQNKINNGNLDCSRLKELYENRTIDLLEFGKASADALKDMATPEKGLMEILCAGYGIAKDSDEYKELLAHCLVDSIANSSLKGVPILEGKTANQIITDEAIGEKGLMGILCEQCGIEKYSDDYLKLLAHCLVNPDLKDIPLVVADIPEENIQSVMDQKNVNPDPDFCKAVMNAEDIEAMAEVYSTFFNKKMEDDPVHSKNYKDQKDVLCRVIFDDMARCPMDLIIGEKKVRITGNKSCLWEGQGRLVTYQCRDEKDFKATFDSILGEIQSQGQFSPKDSLNIMKQFLLGSRGQNGQSDCAYLVQNSFPQPSTGMWIKTGNPYTSMEFKNVGKEWKLQSKIERGSTGEMVLGRLDTKTIPTCRFKLLPLDEEIRTDLPVKSTREESTDGTIQWNCPFRKEPPKKIILYGGNTPEKQKSQ